MAVVRKVREIRSTQIRKGTWHDCHFPLESNLSSAKQSPSGEIAEGRTEIIVNPEVAINPQQESLHSRKWKKAMLAAAGCAGLIGYSFRKHYQHDLYAYIIRSEKDTYLTKLLQYFRILPSQDILRVFDEYCFELYCERLAYYLFKRILLLNLFPIENPFGWKCLQDAVSYFNTVLPTPSFHV